MLQYIEFNFPNNKRGVHYTYFGILQISCIYLQANNMHVIL